MPATWTGLVALAALFSHPGFGAAAEGTRMIFDFGKPDANEQWQAVNDTVMGGVSEGDFRVTEDGTLVFFGSVSLQNNGGFASIRSRAAKLDLCEFDGLRIRVRGDGKRYACNLRTDVRLIAGSYRILFDTVPDTWQELFLPFSDFEATSFGRVVRSVPLLDPGKIRSFGFMISDKQEGSFRLEVDWIQAAQAAFPQQQPASPLSEVDSRAAARALIELAIARGVPLFNAGQHQACVSIYEVAAAALVSLAKNDLPPSAVGRLEAALSEAAQASGDSERAWILRRALDFTAQSMMERDRE